MNRPASSRPIPLAERMRPRTLDEVLGQEHLVGPDALLPRLLAADRLESMILWGPPGSGKTTLARIVGQQTGYPFHAFSAVTSGIREIRTVMEAARKAWELFGRPSILFVDEIHRFHKGQQDAFLPWVENGRIVLIGATTQNPSFEVIAPLLSRARVLVLRPLDRHILREILLGALKDKERGLGTYGIAVRAEALDFLAAVSHGDARAALNSLEAAVIYVQQASPARKEVDAAAVRQSLGTKLLPHDKDGEAHYNLISAFHKSLRGSDSQAALYWLYRMLQAGEDPLFIARRMIRCAAEDVGLADPQALPLAVAAFEAWEKVGPPEAELALAEAAVYLAEAPKSNALYVAEKLVKAEIEQSGPRPVPLHLRNAPTALMKKMGYARGYLYPHDFPGAWVEQEYLPKGLSRRQYYLPGEQGFERRLRRRRKQRRGDPIK